MEQYKDEIWKPINKNYSVSNYGRVFSKRFNRYIGSGSGNGYRYVSIDGVAKQISLIVYETFVGEIPEGYDVNHIDENKHNDCVWNLNLLTHKDNLNWGTAQERKKQTLKITHKINPVIQYTLNGEFVAEYENPKEASEKTGIGYHSIIKCVSNGPHRKSGGGFIWKYKKSSPKT